MSATDDDIKQLLNQGLGVVKIIQKLGVGQGRVTRIKKAMGIAGVKKVAGISSKVHPDISESESDISESKVRVLTTADIEELTLNGPIPVTTKGIPLDISDFKADISENVKSDISGFSDEDFGMKSRPAAKPGSHLDDNNFHILPSTSFSGARVGVDFTHDEVVIADYVIGCLQNRDKRAIGYQNQAGLQLAKKILHSLLGEN